MLDDPARLIRRQQDVLSRRQAEDVYEPRTIRLHLRRARWQAPHPSVLVLHNGPLTRGQQLWVATLAAASGSALWGGSAAEVDGLRDRSADQDVHVVLPPGARRVAIPWVVTHWSSRLGPEDVVAGPGPRRTRPSRSLLDLACSATSERRARTVLYMGVQQRLATAATLTEALSRRGPCRHRAELVRTLQDLEGGMRSVPEKDFDRIVRRRRLPPPSRQAVRQRPNGVAYLDTLWDEYRLAAEVDGSQHADARQWQADLERTADLVAGGLRVLRFTSDEVRRRPERVGAVLEQALRSGGWPGRTTRRSART